MTQEKVIEMLSKAGKPVSVIEAELKMPAGTLAKAKNGSRELPDKWDAAFTELVNQLTGLSEVPQKGGIEAHGKAETSGLAVGIRSEQKSRELPVISNDEVRQGGEEYCNEVFREFLLKFKGLVEDKMTEDERRRGMVDLKEMAMHDPYMTFRQRDAIIGRCDNFLAGVYGNTKRPEHLVHSGLLKEGGKK